MDPITGGGDPCKTTPAADQTGVATIRLPAATGSGYTLLGSPTVIADLKLNGAFPHVVARLWDVAPDGSTQTLVARGLYRPTANGRQVFQLHPNGWRFAAGHTAKLELLGKDAPYAKPSNGVFSVEVSKVDVRLPVAEQPGRPGDRAGAELQARRHLPGVVDGQEHKAGVRGLTRAARSPGLPADPRWASRSWPWPAGPGCPAA